MKKLSACCLWLFACAPMDVAAATFSLDGELMQGGLVRGYTASGSAVFFDGRRLRVSPQGAFVFGLGRDMAAQAVLRVELPAAGVLNRTLSIRAREYAVQRIDGLDDRKVHPTPQDLKRIREENARVTRARTRDDARTDFLERFLWPVHGVITGVYGSQRVLNGQPRRPHFGIDIACRAGAPVKAPAAGVVTLTHDDMFFSGGTLLVDHGHGVSSTFLHLEEILVERGERVDRGQVIAAVGASGRVTGAHLDWRINWFEQRLDPSLVAGEMPAPSPDCLK